MLKAKLIKILTTKIKIAIFVAKLKAKLFNIFKSLIFITKYYSFLQLFNFGFKTKLTLILMILQSRRKGGEEYIKEIYTYL